MHDTVDDLHGRVPAEEGDVVRQLLGGGVGSRACRFTGVRRAFGALWAVCFRLSALLL